MSSPSSLHSRSWIRLGRLVPDLVLVAAVFLTYANSLDAPFTFDDRPSILENPTIRSLWPLTAALSPPADGRGVSGRPLVNLSFALNYAAGGTHVRGYHAINLLLHALTGLLLFGIARRTLLRLPVSGLVRDATPVAFVIALLWLVHPLQTETVTCVVQRTEGLASFFYLLALYLFIRSQSASRAVLWLAGSVGACLVGVTAKEIVVTAPLIVLLYDRTFVADAWRTIWQRRRAYYAALAASWLLLVLLMSLAPNRGGTVGFGLGASSWRYLLTQIHAISLYLKLSIWPHPLVVDYGTGMMAHVAAVAGSLLLLLALVAGTGLALWRWPRLGFVAAWFFVILAPSSSFIPLASQTIAEHRMYLPLAAIIVFVTVGAYALGSRRSLGALTLLAATAGWATVQRNATYRDEVTLWSDTVAHQPQNPRAQLNLGNALLDAGRPTEAIPNFELAARLQPNSPDPFANLCLAYQRIGRVAEAMAPGSHAVELDPSDVAARVNLAAAQLALGRADDAIEQLSQALRLEPGAADVRGQLAAAHLLAGNNAAERSAFPAAISHYRESLALDPALLAARNNLANALLVTGQVDAAITEYREVLRRNPQAESVRENLARALEASTARTPRP